MDRRTESSNSPLGDSSCDDGRIGWGVRHHYVATLCVPRAAVIEHNASEHRQASTAHIYQRLFGKLRRTSQSIQLYMSHNLILRPPFLSRLFRPKIAAPSCLKRGKRTIFAPFYARCGLVGEKDDKRGTCVLISCGAEHVISLGGTGRRPAVARLESSSEGL